MEFRDKLIRFFYGRYGIDQLYYALFILSFVPLFAVIFVKFWPIKLCLYLIWALILAIMTLRMLSKKIQKRRKENAVFLKVWNPVKNFVLLTKNRIRDFKGYRYRKCTHCKAMLRLPKRKGEHSVICPRCKKRFTAKVRF